MLDQVNPDAPSPGVVIPILAWEGTTQTFQDSDLATSIETVACALHRQPNPELEWPAAAYVQATGKRKDLARFFVDERGQEPRFFVKEALAQGRDLEGWRRTIGERKQSHVPVREAMTSTRAWPTSRPSTTTTAVPFHP